LSFKVYEEEENKIKKKELNYNNLFNGFLAVVQAIFVISLTILQINQLEPGFWRGFFIFAFISCCAIELVLFTWVGVQIYRFVKTKAGTKKLSNKHIENLKNRIQFSELITIANEITDLLTPNIKISIKNPNYFCFYTGLEITIRPFEFNEGRVNKSVDMTLSYLCKFEKSNDKKHYIISDSKDIKEHEFHQTVITSYEIDEWKFTFEPLIQDGWKKIQLYSTSLTPGHRLVKLCLFKDQYLLIYSIFDLDNRLFNC